MVSSVVGVCFFLAGFAMVIGDHVHEFVIARDFTKFSWKNCDKAVKYPLTFTQMSLIPDEIHTGSVVRLNFTAVVDMDIGTTNTLQLDMKAKFDASGIVIDACDYIKCHYKDFCSFIKKYQSQCPPVISQLVPGCQCPLKKNKYVVVNAAIPIPSAPISIDGDLNVRVNVTESNKNIACLEVTVGVK